MKLDFKKLREISEYIEKGEHDKFIEFLNSYSGSNTFEKFKNILIDWEYHVSHTLNLNVDNRIVKIQLSYIINELPLYMNDDLIFESSCGIKIILSTPKKFNNNDVIPVFDMIKRLELHGHVINTSDLTEDELNEVITNLPASVFNDLLSTIIACENKTVEFKNPAIKSFKLQFCTKDPVNFLIGLFSNFTKDYFRQILFHLSKRISEEVIINSDIHDIEFFIEEYNKEIKDQQNTNPSIA